MDGPTHDDKRQIFEGAMLAINSLRKTGKTARAVRGPAGRAAGPAFPVRHGSWVGCRQK